MNDKVEVEVKVEGGAVGRRYGNPPRFEKPARIGAQIGTHYNIKPWSSSRTPRFQLSFPNRSLGTRGNNNLGHGCTGLHGYLCLFQIICKKILD